LPKKSSSLELLLHHGISTRDLTTLNSLWNEKRDSKKEENKGEEREDEEREGEEKGEEEGEEEGGEGEDVDKDDEEDEEEKVIHLNIKVSDAKIKEPIDLKCSVSKDGTIFLDSVTTGGKTLDDIFALNENTIEKLFEFLEEHGVDEHFGLFCQSYNVTRKLKDNLHVVKSLVSFLQKE